MRKIIEVIVSLPALVLEEGIEMWQRVWFDEKAIVEQDTQRDYEEE